MRRTPSIRLVAVTVLLASWSLLAVSLYSDDCKTNSNRGQLDCRIEGGDEELKPRPPPPPIRYLVDAGGCWYWSRYAVAGAIDAWEPLNELLIIYYVNNVPRCEWDVDDIDRAWEIFRSFPLAVPTPAFQPADHGITNQPAWLSTPSPARIYHYETLPDGQTVFEVRASVVGLRIDWGDGSITDHDVASALPWPDGTVNHAYTRKTCTAEYRETHPSGRLCHPTLEAYPVTATYTWFGEYRIGPAWIPIGTLDLSATAPYDIDDVVGVLIP